MSMFVYVRKYQGFELFLLPVFVSSLLSIVFVLSVKYSRLLGNYASCVGCVDIKESIYTYTYVVHLCVYGCVVHA